MGYPLYYSHFGGTAPPRSGPDHATIVPYGSFRTGDGRSVMLGIQNDREWKSFCGKVLGRPELAADSRYDTNSKRNERRPELVALVEKAFAALTTDAVVARLDEAGIANARVNTPEEVWRHAAREHRLNRGGIGHIAGLVDAAVGGHRDDVASEQARHDCRHSLRTLSDRQTPC